MFEESLTFTFPLWLSQSCPRAVLEAPEGWKTLGCFSALDAHFVPCFIEVYCTSLFVRRITDSPFLMQDVKHSSLINVHVG